MIPGATPTIIRVSTTTMQFTDKQKRQFIHDGYIVARQAVAPAMIEAARKLINHTLGDKGMNEADLPKLRAQSYCPDVRKAEAISDLFNQSSLFPLVESLVGVGRISRRDGAQIALRFPGQLFKDPPPPKGHLDGLGSGLNGSQQGEYARGFTALVTVYLADVPEIDSGNFTVWPGSHVTVRDHLLKHGVEVLGNGQPRLDWPHPPVQVTGRAGDAVISHHQLIHTAAANASPNIRYAAIFRVHHVNINEFAGQAFTDIWHEWEGLHELLAQPETQAQAQGAY